MPPPKRRRRSSSISNDSSKENIDNEEEEDDYPRSSKHRGTINDKSQFKSGNSTNSQARNSRTTIQEVDRVSDEEMHEEDASECGTIKSVKLVNFMCHEKFQIELGPRVNFITGRNGSKYIRSSSLSFLYSPRHFTNGI